MSFWSFTVRPQKQGTRHANGPAAGPRGQRSGLASKREQKPFWRGREGSARPKCRSRAGFQASGAGLESWPGARKLALSLWRADSPAAGISVALGGFAMQLSRFVVRYDHVRPGEHVL